MVSSGCNNFYTKQRIRVDALFLLFADGLSCGVKRNVKILNEL